MSSHVWSGEKKRRAISSSDLKMRLDLNKKYQSKDFQSWLRKRLAVKNGEQILDVGCGTGAQTIPMAEDAGIHGKVISLDISSDSIEVLKNNIPDHLKDRIYAHTLDMALLKDFLFENYNDKFYSLAQCSYALYYSPKRMEVLEEMQKRTSPHGRVAVFTPCPPHGMIEFVSKYHEISLPVKDSLYFGENTLRDLFRECFWEVEVHYFQSVISIDSLEDFKSFYEATTYFNEDYANDVYEGAKFQIERDGALNFEKCGILLIGSGNRKLVNEAYSE